MDPQSDRGGALPARSPDPLPPVEAGPPVRRPLRARLAARPALEVAVAVLAVLVALVLFGVLLQVTGADRPGA